MVCRSSKGGNQVSKSANLSTQSFDFLLRWGDSRYCRGRYVSDAVCELSELVERSCLWSGGEYHADVRR